MLVEGFAWALADHDTADVINAIGIYVRKNPNIPTPSEIIAIINPPIPPFKPDWAFYNRLVGMIKESGAYAVTSEELDYINACEAHSKDAFRTSREAGQ